MYTCVEIFGIYHTIFHTNRLKDVCGSTGHDHQLTLKQPTKKFASMSAKCQHKNHLRIKKWDI